ncbi:hypothetical protein ACSVH2_02070 [Flavobacterium sp. RSB2_4_14]|uniref:hypothetical protein n=1 Tax=Flavobacterium sp. RSB2_4_14 TaxID=3447665 RepID=UPI003F362B31
MIIFFKKLLLLSCFFSSLMIFSQEDFKRDSIPAFQIKLLNINFRDFVIIDKLVYAVTNDDRLIILNIENKKFIDTKQTFASIALNSKNKIIGVTRDGIVKEQINKNKYVTRDKVDGKVYKILVDKNDDFIVITDEYVRYKKENFIPEKDSPMYRKAGRLNNGNRSLIPIDVYYLDDENRVWFGYDAGEWGGDVCFFDLNKKQLFSEDYIDMSVPNENYTEEKTDKWNPKTRTKTKAEALKDYPDKVKVVNGDTILKFPSNLYISNIKGVTQNEKGHYYIATSMMHFYVSSGLSKKIKTTEKDYYKDIDISDVLEYKVYRKKKEKYIDTDGKVKESIIQEWKESLEYLGGITFNPFDKKVYYYTNNGFWKLLENNNLTSKEFIFKPWIYWKAGLPDAVGYQMNVTKFEFISEKEIIFLTTMNGIGYFDGKTVTYFK